MIECWNVEKVLADLSDDVTCLSLDCFDTLLWRVGNAPRDVFAELTMEGGAVERRMRAESIARGVLGSPSALKEVTLDDIYRVLMPDASIAERRRAIEAELAAEAKHCFGFTPVATLLKNAHARGLKTIIVSDTYLTAIELRALIAAAAGTDVADAIDDVFASCEYGASKSAGLFEHVIPALGIAPDAILHLGDNHQADVVSPAKLGVRTIHLRQFSVLAERKLRLEAAAATMIDAKTRVAVPVWQPQRTRIATNACADADWTIGHDVLGPVFEGFAVWLRDEIAMLSKTYNRRVRPLFLLRDGHLPRRVFDAIGGQGGASVAISRFTARCAGFESVDAILRYLDDEPHGRIDAHLKQLLLTPSDLPGVAYDLDGLRKFVCSAEVSSKVIARSRAFADRLIRHAREDGGVADGDTIVLVDLGYNGSVQDAIEPVLKQAFGGHIAGRYLLLRETTPSARDKRGFFDPRHYDYRVLAALTGPIAVVEQLATESAGSVIDYAPSGTPMRDKRGPNKRQAAVRARVQEGAVSFARAGLDDPCTSQIDITPDMYRRVAMGALARLLYMPTADEVALLASFEHDVNLGTKDTNRLIDLDRTGSDLRRSGLSYLGRTRRLYPAGELAEHGFGYNLAHFGTSRLGLDLRDADFQSMSRDVQVVVADAQDQTLIDVTAWSTHDGYYRLAIPIGRRPLTLGILLGRQSGYVEVDSVEFHPVDAMSDPLWDGDTGTSVAHVDHDGMRPMDGNLYACTPDAMLLVHPPGICAESLAAVIVFRPVGGAREVSMRQAA